MNAATLTDDALTAELGRLAGREREATAALIVHLAEFDARRLYEGAGYPSMFAYCRAVLRLSEDAAYNRIKTARAARTFPAIVEMLTDGSLSPTTVRLLAPHLTIENGEATRSDSRPTPRPASSCARRRTSSVMPSPRAISPPSSIVR